MGLRTALAAWALSLQKKAELAVVAAETGVSLMEAVSVDRFESQLRYVTASEDERNALRELAIDAAKLGVRRGELEPAMHQYRMGQAEREHRLRALRSSLVLRIDTELERLGLDPSHH